MLRLIRICFYTGFISMTAAWVYLYQYQPRIYAELYYDVAAWFGVPRPAPRIIYEQAPLSVRPTAQTVGVSPRIETHDVDCRIVRTAAVEVKQQKVYRWVDANGRVSYSDKPPQDTSGTKGLAVDRVVSSEKKFQINVQTQGAAAPPLLAERIRQASEKIYRELSEPLTAAEMRQSDIQVNILADKNAFYNAYGPLKPGGIVPAGFYTSRTNEAFVLVQHSHEATQRVAIHETSHVIMAALYQRTPPWLNEGMAEYFEASLNANPADNKTRLSSIRGLKAQGMLPVEQLLSLNGEQWAASKGRQVYPSAWLMVSYMMKTSRGRNSLHSVLRNIKDNPCRPVSSYAILDQTYPGGVQQLKKEIAVEVQRLTSG